MYKYIELLKTNGIKQISRKILKRNLNKVIYLKYKYYFKKSQFEKRNAFKSYESEMKFFYNLEDKKRIKTFYLKNPEITNSVFEEANSILKHEVDILGAEKIYLGENISWNKDYINNYTWENKYYKDIEIIDFNKNFDVKHPWELSRFNHLFVLGKAFWISSEIKYFKEFQEQILSWIEQNEFNYSVNWTSTMEVSIRASNLIFSYYHFKDLIDKELEFKEKFIGLLYMHGKYIYDNLENYDSVRNNHYIANLVGLIFLGAYFKDYKNGREAKKWLKKGLKELEKEIVVQINDDGSSFETSTSYHRLVSEFLLYSYILCEKNNISLSDNYKDILLKMHEHLIYITKPNNLTPLIGDNDNGRFIVISKLFWNKRNLNHTMGLFGYYFNYRLPSFLNISLEEIEWIKQQSKYNPPLKNHEIDSVIYKDAGLYKLENEIYYCLIRCGELSMRGQGGHSHNDQLSIELNVNGRDFFIDPGSFTYTGSIAERNKDRSTSHHSTLIIEGIEQNNFNDNLFLMKEETFSKVIEFEKNSFIGEHYGYRAKGFGVHNRSVKIEDSLMIIIDKISWKDNENKVFQYFILSPDVSIEENSDGILLINKEVKIFVEVEKFKIESINVSYGYGNKISTKKLIIPYQKEIQIKQL